MSWSSARRPPEPRAGSSSPLSQSYCSLLSARSLPRDPNYARTIGHRGNMSATNKQKLDRVVAENCLKLFTDYKLDIRAREPGEAFHGERFLLCGIMGFTAKQLRGALVLATTREPLDRTNPDA